MTKHFAIAIFCVSCVPLVGCADNSPDGLMKQQIGLMNELSAVFETIKDVPSAEAAAPKIQAIGERKKALDLKFGQLKLSPEQQGQLTQRHRAGVTSAAERLIKSRPKNAQILRNEKFSKAFESAR